MSSDDLLLAHLPIWRLRLAEGAIIPFLGAGANRYDRPSGADWLRDHLLPDGTELADHLATKYSYPKPKNEAPELVRVAQYVDLMTGGEAALFESLRELFTGDYQPNRLHEFLAELPAKLRAEERPSPCQLIITTNYDDALERAFETAREEFDLVYYVVERDEPGRFIHLRPDGKRVAIRTHTRYSGFALGKRTVILKIHGAVDRGDPEGDSYVITEDHYIDYLAQANLSKLIPAPLMAKMRESHFLFLGYGLRDWNLRVILKNIWSEQARRSGSWAIQKNPNWIDREFWQRHGVRIIDVTLEEWVDAMREQLA